MNFVNFMRTRQRSRVTASNDTPAQLHDQLNLQQPPILPPNGTRRASSSDARVEPRSLPPGGKRMDHVSPTKRRKTRGALAMRPRITWPKDKLPVEIFTLIVEYLPRSNIQNMRLVNKEFEGKVAQILFRTVVVPFKPEIYGISSDTIAINDGQSSIMLQDKGMRVFQGFGRWIHNFAMSFEIDQNRLTNPPVKTDQEAITTFWGLYRWPFKRYNRYTQLEGLEQTADETRSMAKALRYINKADELGLSIDGGLGWLCGPDVNSRVDSRGERLSVFGPSRFVPETKPRQSRVGATSISTQMQNSGTFDEIRRIVEEAGYTGERMEIAARMILETEGVSLNAFDAVPASHFQPDPPLREAGLRRTRRIRLRPMALANGNARALTAAEALQSDDEDVLADGHTLHTGNTIGKRDPTTVPLIPNDLSNAQREMLLEMEWAQSAFMQSWAIAIIDNADTFRNIRTLTIARLPHRHLSILCRNDFWSNLPSLATLSLAVIPDWREVKKEATSWVEDSRLNASESLPCVYRLFSDYVAKTANITTLHFEWICGGEYAPGLFARNKLILAAPIVSTAMDMVNRTAAHPVLALPHIEHLSLRNCWLSPHIMKSFLFPMKSKSLKSLIFDSVSLTAPVPASAHPGPLAQQVVPNNQPGPMLGNGLGGFAVQVGAHVALQNAALQQAAMNNFQNAAALQNLQNHPAFQVAQQPPPPPANIDPGSPEWLQSPRANSWSEIIDMLSPAVTIADIRYQRDIGSEPTQRQPTHLKKLAFISCGYVRLPLDFDQSVVTDAPAAAGHVPTNLTSRRSTEIDSFMMQPQENTLGTVVNRFDLVEKATLENAWQLSFGWDNDELAADCLCDGIARPGEGRFEGLITAPPSVPRTLY